MTDIRGSFSHHGITLSGRESKLMSRRAVLLPGSQASIGNSTAPPTFNRNLALWSQHHVARTIVNTRTGTLSPKDLHHASQSIAQYAQHLKDINFDVISKGLADRIDPGRTDLTNTVTFSKTLAALQAYDPSYTAQDLAPTFTFSRRDLIEVKESLVRNGFVWHLRRAADGFHTLGRIGGGNMAGHLGSMPHASRSAVFKQHSDDLLRPAVLTSHEGSPHFTYVSIGSICKKILCYVLATAIPKVLTAALVEYTADEFCTADLIVSILGDTVSEGMLATLSPIEALLCSAAEAAKDPVTGMVVTMQINNIIGFALGPLGRAAGCTP